MICKPWPKTQVRGEGRGSQDSKRQWEKGAFWRGKWVISQSGSMQAFKGPAETPEYRVSRKALISSAWAGQARTLTPVSRLSPPPPCSLPARGYQSGSVRTGVHAGGGREAQLPAAVRKQDLLSSPGRPPSTAPTGLGHSRRRPAAATYPTCCCTCSRCCCCRCGRCYCCGSEAVFSRAVNHDEPGPLPPARTPAPGRAAFRAERGAGLRGRCARLRGTPRARRASAPEGFGVRRLPGGGCGVTHTRSAQASGTPSSLPAPWLWLGLGLGLGVGLGLSIPLTHGERC